MQLANTPATGGPEPGTVAADAVAPDSLTAELLRKHAAGEKLSPQQYGKLGAWKAKLKGVFRPSEPAASPASPPPAEGGALVGPTEAPSPSQALSTVDPDLVRRTTAAILQTCDGIARNYVANEARKAGADDATLREFERAAALQPGPRELMVNTSPEVAAALGIDANNYPVAAFCTGLTVWSGSLLLAVSKLQALQAERLKHLAPAKPANEHPSN